ncbi:MAG: hypothetical protein M1300_03420, partial [Epsilonproteobacteria bacterium]|nr:hypothetical protein [Campylobacterota bacterium]
QHQQLETLKLRLNTLRTVNQQYAKMVLSVGAFFNTLLERIMPTQMHGYKSVATRDSAFLEVRA